jgi:hypothetical protein
MEKVPPHQAKTEVESPTWLQVRCMGSPPTARLQSRQRGNGAEELRENSPNKLHCRRPSFDTMKSGPRTSKSLIHKLLTVSFIHMGLWVCEVELVARKAVIEEGFARRARKSGQYTHLQLILL